MAAGRTNSYTDRVNRQYEAQFQRPVNPSDPDYVAYVKTALPAMIQADAEAQARSKQRWRVADRVALMAAIGGMSAGALSAFAPAATPMASMAPTGTGTAGIVGPLASAGPYGPLTAAGGWSAANTVAPAAGSWLARNVTGRDVASLASSGIGALTNIYGTNKANSAAEAAAAEQRRQYEETQKFLEEQARIKRDDDLAVEAEKKRQWEAEQAEKLRRYEAQQPWRDAGQQNLVRMSTMLDRPKPMPTPYQSSFTSNRPF